MHRRGWDDCLQELDREWNLDRKPIFAMQGYGWQARGYTDGYMACQSLVAALVKDVGAGNAKQAVRESIAAMKSQ